MIPWLIVQIALLLVLNGIVVNIGDAQTVPIRLRSTKGPVDLMTMDGRHVAFMVDTDKAVWYRWQTPADGQWGEWVSLAGVVIDVAAAENVDGRLEVFAHSGDGNLWHKWQQWSGGEWSDWEALGGITADVAVIVNPDGQMEVLAHGGDGNLWHRFQQHPASGPWSDWAVVPAEALPPPQSRTDLGVGVVEDGLGVGPGAGRYDLKISISSPKRYNVYSNDGGHTDTFCFTPDVPLSDCLDVRKFDGVGLRPQDDFWPWTERGLVPWFIQFGRIDGPFQNGEGKWEWPDRAFSTDGYWTFRRSPFLTLRYRNVAWSGLKSEVESVIGAQWIEPDPAPWYSFGIPQDDYSEKAYFNVGDMIHRCLQSAGNPREPLEVLPDEAQHYWYLCSEDGDCDKGDGSDGLHYKIQVHYAVECTWKPHRSIFSFPFF